MIRDIGLPELLAAWQNFTRDAASNLRIQVGIADDGAFRTEADTLRDLGYRKAEWAAYAAAERKAGRVPQPETVWRPIQPYGASYHNFGAARDAKIISRPAGMSYDQAVKALRGIAARNGLATISSKNDQLHFQLPVPLTTARDWWTQYQARTGRYADVEGLPGGDIAKALADDAMPDDGQKNSSSGGALVGAVVGLALAGGLFVALRRFAA